MENEANKNVTEIAIAAVDCGLALLAFPPLASITFKGVETVNSFRDGIFIDNMHAFLSSANKLTSKESEAFLHRLAADRKDFYKKLIGVIDRMHDEQKSKMIGNLFVHLVRNDLSVRTFNNLCFQIERVFADNFEVLKVYTQQPLTFQSSNPSAEQNLLSSGFLQEKSRTIAHGINPIKYEVSELGHILVRFAFDD
jgi:hypothetical protein